MFKEYLLNKLSVKNKNLGLNFEKITISRLKQTNVNGGANNAQNEIEASKYTERGPGCTWCLLHPESPTC